MFINVYNWTDPKFAGDPTSTECWYSREEAKEQAREIIRSDDKIYLYTIQVIGRDLRRVDFRDEIEAEDDDREHQLAYEGAHRAEVASPYLSGRI